MTCSKHKISSQFRSIIPYEININSNDNLLDKYPFITKLNKPLNLYRAHFIVAIIINLICVFNTIAQFWFILYGPSPYRWITLAIFIWCHLVVLLLTVVGCYYLSQLGSSRQITIIISVFVVIFFPIIPIANLLFVYWSDDKTLNNDPFVEPEYGDWLRSTLWVKCMTVAPHSLCLAIPQIISLTVMLSSNDYHYYSGLKQVIDISLISCILMIISFCFVITSVYEQTSIYILYSIWTMLDYVILLLIISGLFYDDMGMIVFIIDMILASLPWIMYGFSMGILIVNEEDSSSAAAICNALCMVSCFVLLCPFWLITYAPWTILLIGLFEQLFKWNILPFNLNLMELKYDSYVISFWCRYRLFEWIKDGHNKREKNMRLICVNMIILDSYYKNDDNFNALKQNMMQYVKKSDNFPIQIVKDIANTNYSVYDFSADLDDDDGDVFIQIMKSTFFMYVGIRFIHLILPIIVAIYVGFNKKWNLNDINFTIRSLIYATFILYGFCIISILIVWKSTYYHRMIIPFKEKQNKTFFTDCHKKIANCHHVLCVITVLQQSIGNRDIAFIILQFYATNDEKSDHVHT